MKTELEEAAERIFNIPEEKKGDVYFGSNIAYLRKGFNFGAKWQAEQNKEYIHKLLDIIQWYDNNSTVRPDLETFKWYEQFKKKA